MISLHMTDGAIEQFRLAIISRNLTPPQLIIADGQYHRFGTNEKHSDKAGWYVLDCSGQPHGAFGCWRSC